MPVLISFLTTYLEIIAAILPIFGVIFAGLIVRRLRILTHEADASLMRLVIHCLYPALILSKTLGNEEVTRLENLTGGIGSGAILVLGGMAIAWGMGSLAGCRERADRGTFAVTNGLQNYGFIAIPVLIQVFAHEDATLAKDLTGVLFVHSLGVELALWTVGVLLLSGGKWSPRQLLNGPIIAVVFGLLLNAFGIGGRIPDWIMTFLGMLGASSIPLSLILVGASLRDLTREPGWRINPRVSLLSTLTRLAIIPSLFWLALAVVPFTPELQKVLIVQAAMPTAMAPIFLSRHYGANPDVAAQSVIASTLLSVLTIPAAIQIGIRAAG
ncbi:MAG: AEC family transporter [Verrucomicrobiota bacterium]